MNDLSTSRVPSANPDEAVAVELPLQPPPLPQRPPSSPTFRRNQMWTYFGPAFVASVAYIDPGNFATNILGGTQFGYRLLWVLL